MLTMGTNLIKDVSKQTRGSEMPQKAGCAGNIDGQTNRWKYTNCESNLGVVVIYLPVKFELD